MGKINDAPQKSKKEKARKERKKKARKSKEVRKKERKEENIYGKNGDDQRPFVLP